MAVELRINEILKQKQMLQKDLAEKLGVNKVTVSYWCHNQTSPSLDTLGEIAKVLKVKISELINEN
jgi:transcriptional regulator with XRE-family HTH domain